MFFSVLLLCLKQVKGKRDGTGILDRGAFDNAGNVRGKRNCLCNRFGLSPTLESDWLDHAFGRNLCREIHIRAIAFRDQIW
jgi:hypothetical protein